MSKKIVIKPNEKFGKLTIIKEVDARLPYQKSLDKVRCFQCLCDCGNIIDVLLTSLRSGNSKSCGCIRIENTKKLKLSHGKKGTVIYRKWQGIKTRCYNPNSERFSRYGGRGIEVCQEWINNFQNFYDWAIKNGYKEELSIERKDVNGNYSPENCRWIPYIEQSYNKTNSRLITAFGETKCLSLWAKDAKAQVTRKGIEGRLNRGWNPEKAISSPPSRNILKSQNE